jgi:hypothetical protein
MPSLNFKGKTFVQNHHLAVKYYQMVYGDEWQSKLNNIFV